MAKDLIHPSQQVPDRLVHQQRKSQLKELVALIRQYRTPYIEARDKIREALWVVYSTHLYMEEHGSFQEWFLAQDFGFSHTTAKRMIAESRTVPVERKTKGPNSDSEGSENGDGDGSKDSAGADIPKNLRATFSEWRKLHDHYAEVRDKLAKEYSQTHLKSVLRHFPVVNVQRILQGNDETERWLDDILDHLQAGRPWVVHQLCSGKGCRDCMSRGYLTRAEHTCKR